MKDMTTIPTDNIFRASTDTQQVVLETIKALNLIRSSIDNVPGNFFISEQDQYSILGRIAGYIEALSSDMREFLALGEQS